MDAETAMFSTDWWLAFFGTITIAGLLAGVLTEGFKRKVLTPYFKSRKVKEPWWRAAALWFASLIIGTGTGMGLDLLSWGMALVAGLIGGGAAATIYRAWRKRVNQKGVDEL